MIFINFFYCLDELCSIGNIAYYTLYPYDIITLIKASSYSVNQPAIRCKLPAYSFSDAGRRPGYNCFVHLIAPLYFDPLIILCDIYTENVLQ